MQNHDDKHPARPKFKPSTSAFLATIQNWWAIGAGHTQRSTNNAWQFACFFYISFFYILLISLQFLQALLALSLCWGYIVRLTRAEQKVGLPIALIILLIMMIIYFTCCICFSLIRMASVSTPIGILATRQVTWQRRTWPIYANQRLLRGPHKITQSDSHVTLSSLKRSWQRYVHLSFPSKHETFLQCCFNVGPASKTVDQHWKSIVRIPRVCWVRPKLFPEKNPRFIYSQNRGWH